MKREKAEDLLTRINPKIQQIQVRVDGLQGGISGHDVAAAMKGASNLEWAILRFYAGDSDQRNHVSDWLKALTIRLSDNWKKVKYEQKEALASIALEIALPINRCPTCQGADIYDKRGLPVECPTCKGKRWRKFTHDMKAQMLGIDLSSYKRCWSFRERRLLNEFDQKLKKILEKLSRNL